MFKNLLNSFKSLENITYKIMKKGLIFCLFLCLVSCIILIEYNNTTIPNVYYIGISLFKLSMYFSVDFIVCGFVVDKIKKQII